MISEFDKACYQDYDHIGNDWPMEQEFRAVSCRIRDELDRHAMARFLGRKVMIDPGVGIYERLDGSVLEIDFTRPSDSSAYA